MKSQLTILCVVLVFLCVASCCEGSIPYVRPAPEKRKFASKSVDALIANFSVRMLDHDLATLFSNCYPNTLDTTVVSASEEDSFVITGDIEAMWLRDSTNQVLPYVPFVKTDQVLAKMVRGLIRRQLKSVLLDPYANSFNIAANGNGHQDDKRVPKMTPPVFEGKYELDSLCAVIKLAYAYFNHSSGDTSLIESALFLRAMTLTMETFVNQSKSTEQQNGTYPYQFHRNDGERDDYPLNRVNYTGMVRSAFRPSDDQTLYDFLVPANAMLYVELQHLMTMLLAHPKPIPQEYQLLYKAASDMKTRVGAGLHSAVKKPVPGTADIFAFEVDGRGGFNMMDDANVPSLLSLPFLGFDDMREVSRATRAWVLSKANPFYFCGKLGCGIGSPHTWRGYVWPMSLILRAETSDNDAEIREQLQMLKESAKYTGLMHESLAKSHQSFTDEFFFSRKPT